MPHQWGWEVQEFGVRHKLTTVKFLDKCDNFITIYNLQFKSVQNSQTFKGSSANMER